MLRVDYGAEPLLDPRAGVFLSEAAFCWKAGQAGRFSAVLPPGHPLAGRVRVMDAASEVALSEGGRVTWQGRLTSIERRFDGSVAVEGEDALAYLNDTVVPPYANYAAPDYKGEPNAPRDAGELFAWLVERHNERTFLDSKRFCPGRSMAGRELLRSSTVWPTTASEIKSKLLATGGVLAVRYEAGEKVLDWLDDGAGEGGQRIEFGRNLLGFARTESAAGAVNAVAAVGRPKEGDPFDLRGWDAPTRGDYAVIDGMVIDQAAASSQGAVCERREYQCEDRGRLLELAMDDLDRARLAVSTVEVTAFDLSLVDPSVPPIGYLDWVTVSSRPHGFSASMLCVERRLDALDPSRTRYVLGSSKATLTGGQARTERYIRAAVMPAVEAVPALSEVAKAAAETAEAASGAAAAAAATANRAKAAATEAESAASTASSAAESAKADAAGALAKAGEAREAAAGAASEAAAAAQTASGAGAAATAARDAAADAKRAADGAASVAESAKETAAIAASDAVSAKSAADDARRDAGRLSMLVRETPQGVVVGKDDGSGSFPGGSTRQSGEAFEVLGPDGSAIARLAKDVLELIGGRMSISAEPYDAGDFGAGTIAKVRATILDFEAPEVALFGTGRNSQIRFGKYGGWRIDSSSLPQGGGAKLLHDGDLNVVKAVVEHGGRKTTLAVTNNGVWIDGERVRREKVLYTAPSGANGFTQPTLSESAANFDVLEIFFHDNDRNYGSCRIDSPNGKRATLHAIWADNGVGGNMWIKSRVVSISGTSVKTYNNGTWNRTGDTQINSSTGTTNYYVANITIDKIVGYR